MTKTIRQPYAVWFGSFAIIASTLYFYFQIPLFPIIGGGAFAFVTTLAVRRLRKR